MSKLGKLHENEGKYARVSKECRFVDIYFLNKNIKVAFHEIIVKMCKVESFVMQIHIVMVC